MHPFDRRAVYPQRIVRQSRRRGKRLYCREGILLLFSCLRDLRKFRRIPAIRVVKTVSRESDLCLQEG
jgi:hypothetical protein